MVIFESRDCSKTDPPLSSFQISSDNGNNIANRPELWLDKLKKAVEGAKRQQRVGKKNHASERDDGACCFEVM